MPARPVSIWQWIFVGVLAVVLIGCCLVAVVSRMNEQAEEDFFA